MYEEFTAPQQKQLLEAFNSCFPDIQELYRLLTFDDNFNNIISKINWNEAPEKILFKLMQLTTANGSTKNLLHIVFQAKFKNPKLKKFYTDYFYLPIYNEFNFNILENLFQKLSDDNLKRIIINLFKRYIQSLKIINSLKNIQTTIIKNCYKNLDINNDVWHRQITLIIVVLLSHEKENFSYEIFNLRSEKESSLVLEDFVKGFLLKILKLKISDTDKNIKEQLRQWIQENCPQIEIPPEEAIKENTANYLFIIVEPGPNNKFFLKSQFAQFKNYNTNQKISEFNIELNEENPLADSPKEFPEIIDQIIQKMSQVKKDKGIKGLTTIELFVPFKLLSEDFDIQKIKDDFEEKIPIGMQYPFVVRSYDRFFKTTRTLYDLWDTEWKFLQDKRDNFPELLSKIEVVNNTNINYNPCLAIKVICPILSSKKRFKFFQNVLRKGVVFCLWTRYKDAKFIEINNIAQIFEDILNHKCLKDFSKLYETVKNIRSNQPEDENALGYNLGVLFDHDKFPRLPQNLSTS